MGGSNTRLMEDSSPAVHATQLGAWKQIWWQAEDSALWALAGHVWQLVRPLSDGEAEVRKQAAKAREHRRDKERELAQSRRATVVLDVRRTLAPRVEALLKPCNSTGRRN